MYATNHHRKDLTALEEADALFAASAAGANKTRIRKATGLSREQVAAALTAAKMGRTARETAQAFGYAITLEQLELMAEFDGDEEVIARLTSAFCDGKSGQHEAQQIRLKRAAAAEHERLVEQLRSEGYTIADEAPVVAFMLYALLHDGQELTPETHAACPGRGVYFSPYRALHPSHYCTDPDANGHASRYQPTTLPDLTGGSAGTGSGTSPGTETTTGRGTTADPGRKLVIGGNRARTAACTVRRRWLTGSLLARRTAPKEAMPFIAGQVLAMPGPLRDAITSAPRSHLFRELTSGTMKAAEAAAWPAGRLPLALLAVVAAAYEDRMGGDAGRDTWRTDRPYPRCPRDDAGAYFRFLASVGYELSAIEQAVADGAPYAGDQPEDDLATADDASDDDGEPNGDGEASLAVNIVQAEPGGAPETA